MSFRLGVDVGGTFTDLLLINDATGESYTAKVPSTPKDSSEGVLNGIEKICRTSGIDPKEISSVMHGTTVATNAILTQKGARVGLVTTKGYRQVLHIARSYVPGGIGGWIIFNKQPLLASLEDTVEAHERISAKGEIVHELDEQDIRAKLQELKESGIEALTVCLINAYASGEHEERIGEIAAEIMPDIPVSLSSRVVPEMQEYERTETTVVNSFVRPEVSNYLEHLETEIGNRLADDVQLSILRSDGGLAASEAASYTPVNLLLSGPAGGVAGAIWFCSRGGFDKVLTCDVGGTSTDVALIEQNSARLRRETHVGDVAVRAPSVDVRTIGAGGGSIAFVPELTKALRVGPDSAGAVPGPAAYNKGGEEPTVTDANVVLGYLPANQKLGGDMEVRKDLAEKAVQKVADAMGLTLKEAAEGIVRIANEHMFGALRLISVEQGYDPREFALCGFGGAGPLHANSLGILLDAWPVIIPPSPGVLCAYGDATTRVKDEASRSLVKGFSSIDPDQVVGILEQLTQQVNQSLERQGVPKDQQVVTWQADVRYQGQALLLAQDVEPAALKAQGLDLLKNAFDAEHLQLFSFSLDEEHELVNLRAVARAPRPNIQEREWAVGDADVSKAVTGESPLYFEGKDHSATLYDRELLSPGDVVQGPAIVMEMDSTTVVLPGYQAAVDKVGNLLIKPADRLGKE
jgi:N-methylhydantoinase A